MRQATVSNNDDNRSKNSLNASSTHSEELFFDEDLDDIFVERGDDDDSSDAEYDGVKEGDGDDVGNNDYNNRISTMEDEDDGPVTQSKQKQQRRRSSLSSSSRRVRRRSSASRLTNASSTDNNSTSKKKESTNYMKSPTAGVGASNGVNKVAKSCGGDAADNDVGCNVRVEGEGTLYLDDDVNNNTKSSNNKILTTSDPAATSTTAMTSNRNNPRSGDQVESNDDATSGIIGSVKPPTWHNEAADKEHRKQMILEIARLLQSRKKATPTQEWLHQLPHKARKLEGRLYRTAPSLESYLDRSTLKNRLRILANAITKQYLDASIHQNFNGGFLNLSNHTSADSNNMRFSLSKFGHLQNQRSSVSTLGTSTLSVFDSRASGHSISSVTSNQAVEKKAERTAPVASANAGNHASANSAGVKSSQEANLSKGGISSPNGTPDAFIKTQQTAGQSGALVANQNESSASSSSAADRPSHDGENPLVFSQRQRGSGASGMLSLLGSKQGEGSSGKVSSAQERQQMLQRLQQQQQCGQSHATQPLGQPSAMMALSGSTAPSASLAPSSLAQFSGIHREQSVPTSPGLDSDSKSERERQKTVNAKLQEQIMANKRLQEDLVRRLQAKGQLMLQQQQQLGAGSVNNASPMTNGLAYNAGTNSTATIPNNLGNMNIGGLSGHSPSMSTLSSSTLLSQFGNDVSHSTNQGSLGLNMNNYLINNNASQLSSGNLVGGQVGLNLTNGNGNGMFSMAQAALLSNNLSNSSNSFPMLRTGLPSSKNNNSSGNMNSSLSGLKGIPSQQLSTSLPVLNNPGNSTSAGVGSGISNSSFGSMSFQNVLAVQQRALNQLRDVDGNNTTGSFPSNEAHHQFQLQQMQLLKELASRQSTNDISTTGNNNMMASLQAFQQQQQYGGNDLVDGMQNFGMPPPNASSNNSNSGNLLNGNTNSGAAGNMMGSMMGSVSGYNGPSNRMGTSDGLMGDDRNNSTNNGGPSVGAPLSPGSFHW